MVNHQLSSIICAVDLVFARLFHIKLNFTHYNTLFDLTEINLGTHFNQLKFINLKPEVCLMIYRLP